MPGPSFVWDAMAGWSLPQREWARARFYADIRKQRLPLPEIEAPRIPLALGEQAVLRTVVTVERFLGAQTPPKGAHAGDADRPPGRPRAQGSGDRRSGAVIATTERLAVNRRRHGWEYFWLDDLVDFATELTTPFWVLDLTWPTVKLRLSGSGAPLLAVHVAATAAPDTWTRDPRIKGLTR